MSGNYFEFNNSCYVIDMEKFMEFVSTNTSNEKDTNTTITQVFADTSLDDESEIKVNQISDFKAVSKEIAESKSNNNDTFNNIRYDFARILLNTVISPYYNPDGSFNIPQNEEEMFLGMKIAFNTLLHHGIICEVK